MIQKASTRPVSGSLWCLWGLRKRVSHRVRQTVILQGYPVMYALSKKRQELWLLHYSNEPAHKALSIWQFLAERNIAILEQPSNLPDLALCDFFLFLKLLGIIKRNHFDGVGAIKRDVSMVMRGIPEKSYQ